MIAVTYVSVSRGSSCASCAYFKNIRLMPMVENSKLELKLILSIIDPS